MINVDCLSLEQRSTVQTAKKYSTLLWMVCIYLFLTIERPWESISYLHDLKIEKVFAITMLFVALCCGRLRLTGAAMDKWVLSLLALHFLLAPFAYLPATAFDQGIEYAKIVMLYVLILSCCNDEADLRMVVKAFVLSMAVYVLHSSLEFLNGRHTYRMGIVRMIGVCRTFSDPNTFAASIVLSLPFTWTVYKAETSAWMRRFLIAYGLLGVGCIVLTGSRSGMLGLLFLALLAVLAQNGSQRWKVAGFMVVSFMLVWSFMPEDKQERIRSVWDENAGPANAHESTHGRSLGYHAGLTMFARKPLSGVGAGGGNFIAYRKAHVDSIPEQAHNLAGEVLGEFGLFGGLVFGGFVLNLLRSNWRTRISEKSRTKEKQYLCYLSEALFIATILLLFFGVGGHNFYRPLWLIISAWTSLCVIFSKITPIVTDRM